MFYFFFLPTFFPCLFETVRSRLSIRIARLKCTVSLQSVIAGFFFWKVFSRVMSLLLLTKFASDRIRRISILGPLCMDLVVLGPCSLDLGRFSTSTVLALAHIYRAYVSWSQAWSVPIFLWWTICQGYGTRLISITPSSRFHVITPSLSLLSCHKMYGEYVTQKVWKLKASVYFESCKRRHERKSKWWRMIER